MGVLGVGLLDARLMGGNGTSPRWETTEREEISASVSNHEQWVLPLAAPSLLYDSRASHGEKIWDGREGLEQIQGRGEPTCAILIKKTHLLRHQGPEEAVPKADVQPGKDERKNAAPDTCGK